LTTAGGGRADTVLAAASGLSRARVQRLLAEGHVLVNGQPARKSDHVLPGDEIAITLPDHEHEPGDASVELPILYEDEDVIAVDKPAGLAVHGGPADTGASVAAWFLARYGDRAPAFAAERPGIVHRLDKDTTGVLLLAKTPTAQAALSRAFEQRTTEKSYLAVCDGVPRQPRARIEARIARHPGDRTKMAIARKGREARTDYELLGEAQGMSFLLLRLHTGRTHQARVHLAAIETPVRFDRIYGRPGEGRQLLHAWRLVVPHPAGGWLEVTAPLPPDMAEAVRQMGLDSLASLYSGPATIERRQGDPTKPAVPPHDGSHAVCPQPDR
jgi:23S rRNA pseudouridine1911/1915/1917 synthase